MEHQLVNWSELCPEILSEIANRLGTKPNVHNFRQVCKNWRFSVPKIRRNLPQLSPIFPLRFSAVYPNFFSSLSRGTLHHLIADAVYLLRPRNLPESSKSWLVTVEELYRGKLSVRFPLSRIRAKGFLPRNLNFPTNLKLSDFHVSLIASGFSVRAPEIDPDCSSNGGLLLKNKLVLFANPACFEPFSVNDYSGLLWFEDGRVLWVRLSQCFDWGILAYRGTSRFDDIVNFKGRVYVIDRTGRVYVVHYDLEPAKGVNFCQTLKMECIASDLIGSGCDGDRRKRLVVDSSGVLYLVERSTYCGDKIHFKVYLFDEENCRLDEVVGIGDDRILFVGVDWCFFASTADFPGCRGNCVFFFKDAFPTYGGRRSSDDCFFEGASKGLEVVVFHFENGNVGPISAFDGYSDILWPPPAWFYTGFSVLKPDNCMPLKTRSN